MIKRLQVLLGSALLATLVAGCAGNPVTGQQELSLLSESWEIQTGESHYGYQQQAEGGSYNVDPDLGAYVADVGRRLAAKSDRPHLPYEFVVVNNSVPNAWALPGGKIAIYRGLLVELEDESQLAAVLGHEIVHAAARHSARHMQRALGAQIGQAAIVQIFAGEGAGGALVRDATGLAAGAALARYGRSDELESDFYGMLYASRAGYDPMGAVRLQETFVRLSASRQQDWLSGLFASHPPSAERVAANRKTARELGQGGKVGRDEFLKATARLRKSAPAYEKYDEAVAAMGKRDYRGALTLVDRAIAIENREALFHGLRGEALRRSGEANDAMRAFDRAIELNPAHWMLYLSRGLAHAESGDRAAARRDLQRSQSLLPTEIAQQALSQI